MKGEWTCFELQPGAGSLGLAFRTVGFRCVGVVEPSALWGSACRQNLAGAAGEPPEVMAIGRQAGLKPGTMLKRLGGRPPDVLLAQPPWPPVVTRQGKPRRPFHLAAPDDWFGDPRNQPLPRLLALVDELRPRTVLLAHIPRVMNRRDLGLLALHCTALQRRGYTVAAAQLDDAWFGAPLEQYRVAVLAVRGIRPSELAIYWPPDRLFAGPEEDPGWMRTSRRPQSLQEMWWPLAPPPREALPPTVSLVEAFEDLPPTAFPWLGGTAPLDQPMRYVRQPRGWFGRRMRAWPHSVHRLTMHVCVPNLWRDSRHEPDLHVGWLADMVWRKACLDDHRGGRRPEPRTFRVPRPDILSAMESEKERSYDDHWLKMPGPPVAGMPPLLWQDRFLRLYTGGSPERDFSLREEARLRAIPDRLVFTGGFLERLNQISHAFPTLPGLVLARTVGAILAGRVPRDTLLPECPVAPPPRPAEERRRVEGSRGHTGELPFS